MRIISFIILFPYILLIYVLNPYEVIDLLNLIKEDETELKSIINNISKTFSEAYAYNEISKNPPQPDFDKNYHNKVDIQNLLNQINLTNIGFYDFYRNLIHTISEFKDLHIDIYFNNHIVFNILKTVYSICPIKFEIIQIDNDYQIVGKVNQYYEYYNDDVIDLIKDNYNKKIYIEFINNLNPFDFIDNFCGNIGKTKNPHGSFSHKFNAHYGYNLALFPLDKQDLKLEIIYSNGNKINLDYIFLSLNKMPQLNELNRKWNYENDKILYDKFKKRQKYENFNYKLKLSKFQKEFNNYKSETKNNNQEKKNIKWDYQCDNKSINALKCRIDELNKVNVYYIERFIHDNHQLYKEFFLNCVSLFDKNDYPIIVILNKNDGGYVDLSKLMIELISQFVSITKYMATKKYEKLDIDYDIKEINYGENITGYLTEPVEDLIWLNNEIIERKKKINNKRRPTDILIFTDGFSFSAAATFIKYMQYYGGCITVGYFGNPKLNGTPFDSGQSSSSVFNNDSLYFISNSYKGLNDKYNITMNMPGNQNFFDDLNLTLPLEYLVTPVDERVNIFHHYKDIHYDLFIKEALKIFDKYKTKCNPNNKKLLNFDKDLEQLQYKLNFGGYECGDDGFWSDKYKATFCKDDYVFNYHFNDCIERKKQINLAKLRKIIFKIIYICLAFIILPNICNEIKIKYKKYKENRHESRHESNQEEEELADFYESFKIKEEK